MGEEGFGVGGVYSLCLTIRSIAFPPYIHIPPKNKAADKEGVSKLGKRVLFDAATELPGSGVTSNGFKYTTKVRCYIYI